MPRIVGKFETLTTFEGGGQQFTYFEGSQAVPASPSGTDNV
jgi:hypothetical protein